MAFWLFIDNSWLFQMNLRIDIQFYLNVSNIFIATKQNTTCAIFLLNSWLYMNEVYVQCTLKLRASKLFLHNQPIMVFL